MTFDINNSLGIFPKALNLHAKRAELLAQNLANQDTPNYKAVDIDFREALAKVKSTGDMQSLSTNDLLEQHLKFRVNHQPGIDGNTVDGQIEQAEFTENTMRYQATLRFLSGKLEGIVMAIRGIR